MRSLLFLIAITLAPQALAQDASNIAGFRLGMTLEEVRAVNPEVHEAFPSESSRFARGVSGVNIGSFRPSSVDLIFDNGVLDYIGGGRTSSVESGEACMTAFETLVTAIEQSAGPLPANEDNEPNPIHIGSTRTPGGSYILLYGDPEGDYGAEASAKEPLLIRVNAWTYERNARRDCMMTFGMSDDTAPPADLPQPTIKDVPWTAQPTGYEFARYYPSRGVELSRPGSATAMCTVIAEGALSCEIVHESPLNWGFGQAALRIMRHFRVAPQLPDGTPTLGGTIRRTIRFQPSY
jgi:TonB family protein